jgi:hypothetical protein
VAKTQNRFSPTVVMGDYEEALKTGTKIVFSGASYYGDSFHFLQANLRWLRQHSADKEQRAKAMNHLKILWASPTQELFKNNLELFIGIWSEINKDYLQYFQEQWVKRVKPTVWAYFPRVNAKFPSGDQISEGYHRRLKSVIEREFFLICFF